MAGSSSLDEDPVRGMPSRNPRIGGRGCWEISGRHFKSIIEEVVSFRFKEKGYALKQKYTYAYLWSGFCLIAGLLQPQLNFLFYFSFAFPVWALLKQHVSIAGMFYFWLPYALVIGIGIWLPVFPYYTGLVMAVLFCFLLANLFYLLQVKVKIPGSRLLLLPSGFFLLEFIFHSLPYLSFVELPLMLGVISNHTWLVRIVLLLGSSVSLFVIILMIGILTAGVAEKKISASGLGALVGGFLVIATANGLSGSSLADPGQGVRIAALQGSTRGEAAELRGEEYVDFIFKKYRDLAGSDEADIYVWPEVAAGFYYPENEKYRGQTFIDLARERDALMIPVVMEYKLRGADEDRDGDGDKGGGDGGEEVGAGINGLDTYITALVASPNAIIGKSSKRNLVPFTEAGRITPGDDYEVILTKHGAVGISICYDMNSSAIAKLKGRGAEIIMAPFNDAGFNMLYQRMHSHYPVLKAMQYNIPIIVANEDGISQLVDRNGQVIDSLGVGETGVIKAEFSLEKTTSFYLLAGRYLEGFLLAAILIAMILNSRFQSRAKIVCGKSYNS